MNFKKLLTAVLFVLSSFVGLAQAQTNYDFTATFNNGYGSLVGTVGTDASGYFINGTLNVISTMPGENIVNGNVDLGGHVSSTSDYVMWFTLRDGYNQALLNSPQNYGGTIMRAGSVAVATGTSGLSTGAGAPEIDGSLAPKVGFLLGCLFLMFGRKKQDLELLSSRG